MCLLNGRLEATSIEQIIQLTDSVVRYWDRSEIDNQLLQVDVRAILPQFQTVQQHYVN